MNGKAKLILSILIIIIVVLAVGAGILYFTTDLLKPNEQILKKYFLQNFVNISKIIDMKEEEKAVDYILKNDYTAKTEGTLSYKEKENDQEETYNITEQGIVNNTKNSAYRRIKAKYENEELLNLDLMNIDNTFGAKFTDVTQKFIAIQNPSTLLANQNSEENNSNQDISLNELNLADIFDFSQQELQKLQSKYTYAIFQDIDKKSYSKKKNVMITLNNGKSVTTTRYTLQLSQTEADKIFKRILNQIAEDEIILSKLEKLDNEVKKIGINFSVKEKLVNYIKEKANSIEYSAQNEKKLSINVFVTNEIMVRTSYKTNEMEYILDYDYNNGIVASFQTIEQTNEGENKKVYTLGRTSEYTRILGYKDAKDIINLNYNIQGDEQKIDVDFDFEYSNDNIKQVKLNLKTNLDFSNKRDFQNKFNEQNSILLNDYEPDRIIDILNKLKDAEIKFLEKKQLKINTKLLNNILLWINNKENLKEIEEKNKQNEEINKFNNMFKLFEGENIDYETISKLLETTSENFKDFEVVDGKHIKLLIEPNSTNKEKFEKIKNAISNKYTYNVKLEYDSKGYINVINISIYEKK